MDLSFLFWNTNNKKCLDQIDNLVRLYNIDIIVLVENNASQSEILLKLNEVETNFHPQHPYSLCDKVKIITRFNYEFISPIMESSRVTARRLTLPGFDKINLIGLHYGDKGNFSNESQSEMASELKDFIETIELNEDHTRTILLGDFNMNPFEIGIIKANGIHGTMSQTIAKKSSRTIQGKDYSYFYNPMWSLFGDLNNEPSGTYYYNRSELINYQWNIFDQVLLRPVLIDNFDRQSIQILLGDGKKKFVTRSGIPNRQLYSDHLPIKFKLIL